MKFVFYVPDFTKLSGGIWFCHFLAEEVRKRGHEVRKVYFGKEEEVADDEIIFYPEVIPGNPLGGKNVVRGLLNKDGLLCGEKVGREDNEFVFTYSRVYDSEAFRLFYPICSEVLVDLTNIGSRQLTLLYDGKNPVYKAPDNVRAPLVMMNRGWPTFERTLKFLSEARVLYSSDCWTALLTQALWAGCAPVVTDWHGFTLEEALVSELPEPFQLNQEEDFSVENILKKRESLTNTITSWKAGWPGNLDKFLEKVAEHFRLERKVKLCLA